MPRTNGPRVRIHSWFVLVAIAAPSVAWANRSGPPANFNGSTASGGNSCRACHGIDVGGGSVQILGVPPAYAPSAIYNITVRVSDAMRAGAGFELSVEDGAGQHVGTLIRTDVTNTQFVGVGSRFIAHTSTGVNNSVTNWVSLGSAAEYNLQWQAPSTNLGTVRFWAAGNAINNNMFSTGDRIYLTSMTSGFDEPQGACCDDLTGNCTENVLESTCLGADSRFGGDGSTCGTIDPPCVPPPPPPFSIGLEVVAGGLVAPVGATHANDGSGRLFIVDQSGRIRIVENGSLLPTPFLDITSKLPTLGAVFDERGLLGLAFHPDYASNGRFFVRYSAPRAGDPEEPCNDPKGFIVGCHMEVLAEYQVSLGDPNVADPDSEVILFTVDEPQFNHNGGDIAFGPDGYLYFALGDGGGAHDGLADVPPSHGPIGNGQNLESHLGKLLRIDVDSPPDVGLEYANPPSNPFVGVAGLDEIYAFGLRNPFKFSFDDGPGGTGDLYVADVGQNLYEEVDIVVAGGNYGWVIREGFECFDPFNPSTPPVSCPTIGAGGEPLLDPVSVYSHSEGGLSVIGGYVYRGSLNPHLTERYIYGDFSAQFFVPLGRLYYFDTTGPDAFVRKEFNIAPDGAPFGRFLKGFGEDEDGEIYICASLDLAPSGTSGVVLRIVPPPANALGISPRYLAVTPPPSPAPIALAVAPGCGGPAKYVGTPSGAHNIALLVSNPIDAAYLTSEEWGSPVHVTGIDIAPDNSYNVLVDVGSLGNAALSAATPTATSQHGDVTNGVGGPPDGLSNFVDITAVVRAFQALPGSLPPQRADLIGQAGCTPDKVVNFADISKAIAGFQSLADPCFDPCP